MSDVGWGSDHLEPPKKRRIPLWVLGCGGGCMFFIGAMAVASILIGPKVKRWFESLSAAEVQWPQLAEVLPFDAPPEGVTIERWPFLKIWKLEARSKDLFAFVFSPPKDDGHGPWGAWLLDPKQSPMFASQDGSFECSEGTLSVQGRELRSVRFTRTSLPAPVDPATDKPEPEDPADSSPDARRIEEFLGRESMHGSGLDLVITNDESSRVVLVWLVRGKQGETVTDEDARAFLAPFKIGSDR